MKTTKRILAFAVAGLFFVACKDANTTKDEETQLKSSDLTQETQGQISAENLQTASFTIDGMHCEFGCAKGIEKKLAKLEGIESAKVDFNSKEATIQYDATVHTPQVLAQMVEAMNESYKVSEVKSSSDQSSVYFDKEKPKKEKKSEKAPKSDQSTEKKSCCSGKKSCGSKTKSEKI